MGSVIGAVGASRNQDTIKKSGLREVLCHCHAITTQLESDVTIVEGDLFGYKPECPTTDGKAASDPTIEQLIVGLQVRLNAVAEQMRSVKESL